MGRATIRLPQSMKRQLWEHLLASERRVEEAAFLFVRPTAGADPSYQVIDWHPVPADGFSFSSAYHFELTDDTRARVIKQAHDLGASLVEIHSHLGSGPPAFSPSDLYGFREFVPHVWWRLRGRPYFALVVSVEGVDGLGWIDGPDLPERLAALRAGEDEITLSGRSPLKWSADLEAYSNE